MKKLMIGLMVLSSISAFANESVSALSDKLRANLEIIKNSQSVTEGSIVMSEFFDDNYTYCVTASYKHFGVPFGIGRKSSCLKSVENMKTLLKEDKNYADVFGIILNSTKIADELLKSGELNNLQTEYVKSLAQYRPRWYGSSATRGWNDREEFMKCGLSTKQMPGYLNALEMYELIQTDDLEISENVLSHLKKDSRSITSEVHYLASFRETLDHSLLNGAAELFKIELEGVVNVLN